MKFLSKFESVGSSNIEEVLNNYGLSTSILDNTLNLIEKYSIDELLQRDIFKLKTFEWKPLLKGSWKIEMLKDKLEKLKPAFDFISELDDYLIDIKDSGGSYKIYYEHNILELTISTNRTNLKTNIDAISFVLSRLKGMEKILSISIEINRITNVLSGGKKIFQFECTFKSH